ncbi:hypothetical protein PybrP1_001363 [[Pythium] brassicae (nom. inval.)]|nr:hypothetical protein PybrP1_001363 [[Pythium] brassicae (nom. inval.)]
MARDHERSKKQHRQKSRGGGGSSAKVPEISEDDFFLRATEFRVWLAQTKNKYVEDLTTQEASALFQRKFVKKWNRGRLARMFYEGIPEHVLEQTRRTKHTWGFAARLSDKEAMQLASARDSVGVATRKTDLLATPRAPAAPEPEPLERSSRTHHDADDQQRAASHKRKSRRHHDAAGSGDGDDDDDAARRRHADRKRHRQHRESVLEELAPKETGREAALEKRRQVAGKLHGAARDREENRDGLDVSDAFLMGGSGSDLQHRLQAREQARDRRQQEQQDKLDEFKAKEAARMDKFLQDMGISATAGKPITIAPRKH